MFSVSDIKETVYQTAFRKGKELYETAGVFDFSYELYLVENLPVADVHAKVRGINQEYYEVTASIDEEFGDVTNCNCGCEAFYNYEGMCKHCVAMLLNYVNHRTPMEILKLKQGESVEPAEEEEYRPAGKLETAAPLKNLLSQYSMRATSKYMLPETIYGKVELEPYFEMDYGYARLEFKIGIETKYVLKNISAFLHSIHVNEKVHYGKKLDFYHHMEAFSDNAKRLIRFMQQQDDDKKRQSKFHAYYAYTGGYERTMELDGVGIDRFFEAMEGVPFQATIGYDVNETYVYHSETKKPKLTLKGGSAGAFVCMQELSMIEGDKYYYFYENGEIYRGEPLLKGE